MNRLLARFQQLKGTLVAAAVAAWTCAAVNGAETSRNFVTIQDAFISANYLSVLVSYRDSFGEDGPTDLPSKSTDRVRFGVGGARLDSNVDGALIEPMGRVAYPVGRFRNYPILECTLIWTNVFAVAEMGGVSDVHVMGQNGRTEVLVPGQKGRVVHVRDRSLVAYCGDDITMFRSGIRTTDEEARLAGRWLCRLSKGGQYPDFANLSRDGRYWANCVVKDLVTFDLEYGNTVGDAPSKRLRMPGGTRPSFVFQDERGIRIVGRTRNDAVLLNGSGEELYRIEKVGKLIADVELKNLVSISGNDWLMMGEDGKLTVRVVDLDARRERSVRLDFAPLVQHMKEGTESSP